MRIVRFMTHPEVVIDSNVPVPQWPLSDRGLARMQALLRQPWIPEVTSLYCSTEQKAIDGALVLAQHLSLSVQRVPKLGENDRSSTGFLPAEEFEAVASQFFAHPNESVRGWERASDAQQRIVEAASAIVETDTSSGSIVIVSHGGIGTLLLCHLAGYEIQQAHDQPGSGGGNYYAFDATSKSLLHDWRPIDRVENTV